MEIDLVLEVVGANQLKTAQAIMKWFSYCQMLVASLAGVLVWQ